MDTNSGLDEGGGASCFFFEKISDLFNFEAGESCTLLYMSNITEGFCPN
jgi:hypothetical protein